jgi:hypothetical protein
VGLVGLDCCDVGAANINTRDRVRIAIAIRTTVIINTRISIISIIVNDIFNVILDDSDPPDWGFVIFENLDNCADSLQSGLSVCCGSLINLVLVVPHRHPALRDC